MEELIRDHTRLPPKSINKKDDIEAAVKWMAEGRVNTRGFSEVLPHTSQDLRDGKVTPDQVANSIRLACVGKDPIMGLSRLISMAALPLKFFHGSPSEQNEFPLPLAFCEDVFRKYNDSRDGRKTYLDMSGITLCLKTCVDEVCEQWADRLDTELFRGKKGMFLKKCPLYKVRPEKYHESGMPMEQYRQKTGTTPYWLQNQESLITERQSSILAAAKNIVRGLDDINSMCWECRKVFERPLNRCGKCDKAKYCSRECQVSAWKQGHKQKCKALRSRYAAFVKSMKTVDDAHASVNSQAATQCGIVLSDEMDYGLLKYSHAMPHIYEGTVSEELLGEPSMDAFYKNLGRVVRGEFWFYEDANEVAYREAQLSDEQCMRYHAKLSFYMCYDYVAVVAPGRVVFGENTGVMQDKEELGVAMPSTTFIEMYQAHRKTHAIDRERLKREVRYDTLYTFIEEWHK